MSQEINNIEQYKETYPEMYQKIIDAKKNNPKSVASKFDNVDDAITVNRYNIAHKKNKNLDFVDFYRSFNPQGKYSTIENFKNAYKGNEDILEEMPGRTADRMYSNLLIGKENLDIMNNIKLKSYGDFIFQQAPRYTAESDTVGIRTAKPYTKSELTQFTGTLVGGEEDALPTRGIRSILSLGIKREKALDYLQDYVYEGYQKSGGELSPADRDVVKNNKFLRQNAKTGVLEFYNPKADKYQSVNVKGFDSGDILSLTGDIPKLITETVGGVLGIAGGTILGGISGNIVGAGAGAVGGGFLGSTGGAYVGELVRAGIGNLFFPGLNPEITSMKGIGQILGDEEIQKNAKLAGVFGAAGPVADKIIKAVGGAFKAGRLLTKKDFSGLANNAEEAQLIANKINQGIADSKLLKEGPAEEFYFGVGEATRDPETLMYLNNLYEHDSAFKTLINKRNKSVQENLNAYFTASGDTFSYGALTGKTEVAPGSVLRDINEIISNRMNSKIGKAENDILANSQKSLDEAIAVLPNKGGITDGSYIRTSIGDVQKKLDDKFESKFTGMMETAKTVEFDMKDVHDVLKKITNREKETLFKNSLPIGKMFDLKENVTSVDGKIIIQTLQDLKAFDRKMRTGLISADASTGSVKALITALNNSLKNTKGEAAEGVFQQYKTLNTQYYNAKKALNNTLSDLVAVKNGKLKIQDSDLFETSFTARTKGYKERIDEIHKVIVQNPEHLSIYKTDILNLYRKEVIKPDGSVDLKKHKQFISPTDKGGYGYGLKKFFGDEFLEITKVGGLQKKVLAEAKQLDNLKKELAKTSEGQLQNLRPKQIIQSMLDGDDPQYVADIMKVLNTAPKVKQKVKSAMADYIKKSITDDFENFDLIKFNNFFGTSSGYMGNVAKKIKAKPNTTYDAFKQVFKDDPKFIEGIETIQKTLTIMSRKDTDAIKQSRSLSALMHLLRTKVGLFTPEGRALTAVVRLTEKANQKTFANLITDKNAVRKIAQLNDIKIPKNLTDNNKINNFLRKNKAYTTFVSQFLGDATGIKSAPNLQKPFEVETEEGKKDKSKFIPARDKQDLNEQLNISLNTTQPNVNLFADTPNIPLIDDQPQQVAQAEMPAPEPVSSGIGALNPATTANNYAGLFPDDDLGQAIANRGPQVG